MKGIVPDVVVICLEGVHGIGKTSIINEIRSTLESDDSHTLVHVLGEHFDPLPEAKERYEAGCNERKAALPQTLGRECTWVGEWFTNVVSEVALIKEKATEYGDSTHLIVCDRSPVSGCVYADYTSDLDDDNQDYLMHNFSYLVLSAITNLESQCKRTYDLNVRVLITPIQLSSAEKGYERVSERLIAEPWRAEFNEDKYSHYCKIVSRYTRLGLYYNITDLEHVLGGQHPIALTFFMRSRYGQSRNASRIFPLITDYEDDVAAVVRKLCLLIGLWLIDVCERNDDICDLEVFKLRVDRPNTKQARLLHLYKDSCTANSNMFLELKRLYDMLTSNK